VLVSVRTGPCIDASDESLAGSFTGKEVEALWFSEEGGCGDGSDMLARDTDEPSLARSRRSCGIFSEASKLGHGSTDGWGSLVIQSELEIVALRWRNQP
jgi:hypothetical protein